MVGVSGDGRRPFTVALSAVELEALLTLLDVAARRTVAGDRTEHGAAG